MSSEPNSLAVKDDYFDMRKFAEVTTWIFMNISSQILVRNIMLMNLCDWMKRMKRMKQILSMFLSGLKYNSWIYFTDSVNMSKTKFCRVIMWRHVISRFEYHFVGFSTEHRFLLWCRCEVWDSYCEITLWIHSKFHSTQSTMNWSAFHWKHNCLSFTVRHYVTVPNKDNYRLPRKLPEGNVFSRVCSSVHIPSDHYPWWIGSHQTGPPPQQSSQFPHEKWYLTVQGPLALPLRHGTLLYKALAPVQADMSNLFIMKHVRLASGHFAPYWIAFLLPSATKLRQGNIFTSACQEFCPQGGSVPQGMLGYTPLPPPWADTPWGIHPPGQCMLG